MPPKMTYTITADQVTMTPEIHVEVLKACRHPYEVVAVRLEQGDPERYAYPDEAGRDPGGPDMVEFAPDQLTQFVAILQENGLAPWPASPTIDVDLTSADPRLFDLGHLYYNLGDGVAFNPEARVVTFHTRQSAELFKAAAPEWTCQVVNQVNGTGETRTRLEAVDN